MSRLSERAGSPPAVALLTAALYGLYLWVRWWGGVDPSVFVMAGNIWCDPGRVPSSLTIQATPGTRVAGFDGQFYYRLALDPFTRQRDDFGIRLELAPHRHQRIMYPLLAWALSGGDVHRVPWTLLAVNFTAVCAIGWMGALYARSLGRSGLWGLAFSTYPGFLWTLSYDLEELTLAALLLAGWLALRRGRPRGATLGVTLALFAKETALLAAVAGLGDRLLARWRGQAARAPWAFCLLPLVLYGGWQSVLGWHWGETPVETTAHGNLAVPFAGFVGMLKDANTHLGTFGPAWFVPWWVGVVGLFGAAALRAPSELRYEKVALAAYALLMLCLSTPNWLGGLDMLRQISPFYLLGLILALSWSLRAAAAAAVLSGILWVLIFEYMTRFTNHPSIRALFG